jgi:hypothetical protein
MCRWGAILAINGAVRLVSLIPQVMQEKNKAATAVSDHRCSWGAARMHGHDWHVICCCTDVQAAIHGTPFNSWAVYLQSLLHCFALPCLQLLWACKLHPIPPASQQGLCEQQLVGVGGHARHAL